MRQLEPRAGAGEDHVVVADRVAAAQRGKADIAAVAGAGDAVAAALADLVERDAARAGSGAAQGERSAGRRIGLAAMAASP